MDIKKARTEGGENGQLAEQQSRAAISMFLSIGVKQIEQALNADAASLIAKWDLKPKTDKMTAEGLPGTTYQEGIAELATPFSLFEPEVIVLDIVDASYPKNAETPAVQAFIDPDISNHRKSFIRVYLKAFDFSAKEIILRFSPTTPFRCVIYHELIHACGDTQDLRGITDGAIRHTSLACRAIFSLESSLK